MEADLNSVFITLFDSSGQEEAQTPHLIFESRSMIIALILMIAKSPYKK